MSYGHPSLLGSFYSASRHLKMPGPSASRMRETPYVVATSALKTLRVSTPGGDHAAVGALHTLTQPRGEQRVRQQ